MHKFDGWVIIIGNHSLISYFEPVTTSQLLLHCMSTAALSISDLLCIQTTFLTAILFAALLSIARLSRDRWHGSCQVASDGREWVCPKLRVCKDLLQSICLLRPAESKKYNFRNSDGISHIVWIVDYQPLIYRSYGYLLQVEHSRQCFPSSEAKKACPNLGHLGAQQDDQSSLGHTRSPTFPNHTC